MPPPQWPPSPVTVLWVAWVLLTLVGVYYAAKAAIDAWQRRQEYTRERFAFTALTAITTSLFLLAETIVGEGAVVHLSVQLLNELAGTHLTIPDSTPTVLVWLVFGGIVVQAWLSVNFFRLWDGGWSLSAQQDDPTQRGLASPLREAIRFYRDKTSRSLAPEVKPVDPEEFETPSRPSWEDRVKALWSLKHDVYEFASYHSRDQFWSGTTRDRETTFYVLCVAHRPDDARLGEFLARAGNHADEHAVPVDRREFAVAVELGRPQERTRHLDEQTVEQASEDQLLDDLVGLRFHEYRQSLGKRVAQQQRPNDWMLRDVYVRSKVNGGVDLVDHVRAWSTSPTRQQLALLGDYGSGKTIAALMLCHDWLKDPNPPRVPILIELRGRSPRTLDRGELLTLWAGRHHVDPSALQLLHESGRLILIFEGLDEMDLAGDRNVRSDHIRALWRHAGDGPKTKLLFTSRPNLAFGDAEMLAELGGSRHCAVLRLDPFTITDIPTALQPSPNRDDILAAARSNSLLRDLIGRPFILHVVDHMWSSLRDDRFVSTAAAMRLYLDEIDELEAQRAEGLASTSRLTSAERRYFMRGIATAMTLNPMSATNRISHGEYERLMDDLIRRIPSTLPTDKPRRNVHGEPGQPLHVRMPEGENRAETIKRLTLARGLLSSDRHDPDRITFSQTVFMEYLAAEARAEHMRRRKHRDQGHGSPAYVTDDLILDDTRHTSTARWFAEILRDFVTTPGDDGIAMSQRLLRFIVYPGGGPGATLREGAARLILRYRWWYWTVSGLFTLLMMYLAWEYVLKLNQFRQGVSPDELFGLVVAALLVVVVVEAYAHYPRLRLSNGNKIFLAASACVLALAIKATLWPFAALTASLMLLPLWNYAAALPWMRVWARCTYLLDHDDEVRRGALHLSELPWWAQASTLSARDPTGTPRPGAP